MHLLETNFGDLIDIKKDMKSKEKEDDDDQLRPGTPTDTTLGDSGEKSDLFNKFLTSFVGKDDDGAFARITQVRTSVVCGFDGNAESWKWCFS